MHCSSSLPRIMHAMPAWAAPALIDTPVGVCHQSIDARVLAQVRQSLQHQHNRVQDPRHLPHDADLGSADSALSLRVSAGHL